MTSFKIFMMVPYAVERACLYHARPFKRCHGRILQTTAVLQISVKYVHEIISVSPGVK